MTVALGSTLATVLLSKSVSGQAGSGSALADVAHYQAGSHDTAMV